MPKPLEGILAVSLETGRCRPLLRRPPRRRGRPGDQDRTGRGRLRARLRQRGAGPSSYFVWLNRGKESLVADIKKQDDAALLHRIIAKADVFIQNLAPGAAERPGFGAEALRAKNEA